MTEQHAKILIQILFEGGYKRHAACIQIKPNKPFITEFGLVKTEFGHLLQHPLYCAPMFNNSQGDKHGYTNFTTSRRNSTIISSIILNRLKIYETNAERFFRGLNAEDDEVDESYH